MTPIRYAPHETYAGEVHTYEMHARQVYPYEMHVREMHAREIYARGMHACEVLAYETHAGCTPEVHAYEIRAHEMHAYVVHAYEAYASEMHVHDIHAYEIYDHTNAFTNHAGPLSSLTGLQAIETALTASVANVLSQHLLGTTRSQPTALRISKLRSSARGTRWAKLC